MIDTRKYEGHTPAPWNITVSVFKGNYILEEAKDPSDANEVCVNADLMQDAPLLLEEVKRLRGLLDTIIDITLKELRIFDDNCPMINIRDLAYKGIMWGSKNDD